MKVIFLDIDGVLNNHSHLKELYNMLGHKQYYILYNKLHEFPFDYRSCVLLKKLVDKTDAKVVLTSIWKNNDKGIEKIETYSNIKIYDVTKNINSNREEEIYQYLKDHREIKQYVILDDKPFLKLKEKNYIKINPNFGFTEQDYEICLKILNN